jgi:NAD(P)-dependent dehydrogenase (short-subunit alcohol dehydrogenase family)
MSDANRLLMDGKVALVTGASRGIGAAIAQRFAAEGALVACAARSLDDHPPTLPGTLRDTVSAIESSGGRAVAIQGDVSDAASRAEIVARCTSELGPVDVLVNNAAVGRYRPLLEQKPRDFERTFETNVRGPFELTQLVVPSMKERGGGWILNISSASAQHPDGPPYIDWEQHGGHVLYAASKAALDRMTTALAAELHADNIAVNALSPVAAVITPGMESIGVTQWLDPSMIEPVEAIVEAAVLLCTGDPATLTGRVAYSVPLLEEFGRPVPAPA